MKIGLPAQIPAELAFKPRPHVVKEKTDRFCLMIYAMRRNQTLLKHVQIIQVAHIDGKQVLGVHVLLLVEQAARQEVSGVKGQTELVCQMAIVRTLNLLLINHVQIIQVAHIAGI